MRHKNLKLCSTVMTISIRIRFRKVAVFLGSSHCLHWFPSRGSFIHLPKDWLNDCYVARAVPATRSPTISKMCLLLSQNSVSYIRSGVKVAQSCLILSTPKDYTYSPWNSPGQNPGVGSLSLLQGICPTQGLNPSLLHYRRILYQLSHKGSLLVPLKSYKLVPFSTTKRKFQYGLVQ